jgi:hypothetical protein
VNHILRRNFPLGLKWQRTPLCAAGFEENEAFAKGSNEGGLIPFSRYRVLDNARGRRVRLEIDKTGETLHNLAD